MTGSLRSASAAGVRICVSGCGYWGQNLLRNFSEAGALHALCDQDAARLRATGGNYPSGRTYNRFEDALADEEIAAVAISTPAELHFQMAIDAPKAGKDVSSKSPWRSSRSKEPR